MLRNDDRRGTAPTLTLALAATLGFLGLGLAARTEPSTPARPALGATADNKYIGSGKCKNCHAAEETGDQYGKWHASKHAHAFETLASEEAKKLAAEKGIEDPQKSDECLSCHVTAFGAPEDAIKKGFKVEDGIQCEACHGPGDQHMKARFAAAAKGEGAEAYVEVGADEIVSAPTMETCVQCHNEKSPSYKPFCFHEFSAQGRHLNPKKPRTELVVGPCTCPKCIDGCPDECKKLAEIK